MKRFILCIILVVSQLFAVNVSAEEMSAKDLIDAGIITLVEADGTDMYSYSDSSEYIQPMLSTVAPAELGVPALPAKYDARDDGRIYDSGVGQDSDNTCWAFTSCLAAETAIKDDFGAFTDLSENHLKYSASSDNGNPYGYNRVVNSGGNFKMFEAYAASWRGLVKESDDPYVYGGEARDWASVTAKKPVSFHVKETINIPNVANTVSEVTKDEKAKHIDEVKKYVYEYGCCFSSMYWDSAYNNYTTHAYFNKSNDEKSNHAVAIIGWDDNYSKNNFNEKPENDGAFIIKNSQSKTGYVMYMSYEDMYAGWDASCVAEVDTAHDYGEVYNYNYFEPGAAFGLKKEQKAVITNVFASKTDGENVVAVGAYTRSKNMKYEVYLSKTANGNEATEEAYTRVASGTFEMPGLHTVDFSGTPFKLGEEGTVYCVRIMYSCDNDYEVPIEVNNGSAIKNVDSKPGRCFFGYGGQRGFDVGADFSANLYIRAYTQKEVKLDFPFAVEEKYKNATYSVNGSAAKKVSEKITVFSNDEVVFDFSSVSEPIGNFCYLGNVYKPVEKKIKLKASEDGKVVSIGNNTIAVSFSANGGSGAPSDIYTTENTEVVLPETVPVFSGYTFEGWSVPGVSGVVKAGAKLKFTSSVCLSAVWKRTVNDTATLSVKAYSNGKEVSALFAGMNYELAICMDNATNPAFFGADVKVEFDSDYLCVVDREGYLNDSFASCVFGLPSNKLSFANGSSFDNESGSLRAVISPKASAAGEGVQLEGSSVELMRFSIYAMRGGSSSIKLNGTTVCLGGEDNVAELVLNPLNLTLKYESVSSVTCSLKGSEVSFGGIYDFAKDKTLVVAAYDGIKLVGVKLVRCNTSGNAFSDKITCSAAPDNAKIFVWDGLKTLSTGFGAMEFEF